jgi:hypothetical protein
MNAHILNNSTKFKLQAVNHHISPCFSVQPNIICTILGLWPDVLSRSSDMDLMIYVKEGSKMLFGKMDQFQLQFFDQTNFIDTFS